MIQPYRVAVDCAVCLIAALAPSVLHADPPALTAYFDNIRISINGQYVDSGISVPLTGGNAQGSGSQYITPDPDTQQPVNTPYQNCKGTFISGNSIALNAGWEVGMTINNVECTLKKEHLNAFYDFYYDGYDKVGDADASQNCMGYAFGVGGWPRNITAVTNLLNIVQNNQGASCYWQALHIGEAAISVTNDNASHGMKVTGMDCPTVDGSGVTQHNYVTEKTDEKFRGSRVYKQNGGCPGGVNRFKMLQKYQDTNNNPLVNANFILYKKL